MLELGNGWLLSYVENDASEPNFDIRSVVTYYAMVAGISHDIAFGMYHVGCKGIPHDYVVCVLPF